MRLQVGVHGPVPLHTLNCTAETHRCAVKTHQLTHAVPLALLLAPFRPSLFFTRAASKLQNCTRDSGFGGQVFRGRNFRAALRRASIN
jgi:hypothetical protein